MDTMNEEQRQEIRRQRRLEYLKNYRESHREERRQYMVQWRAANKDRVAETNARYWAKKAAEAADREDQP